MNKTNYFQDAQGMLSLGYIYLVVLGIINETLSFYPTGLNIIKYSSILDVLISPVSKLTENPVGIIFFLILVVSMLYLPNYFMKKKDKDWFQKAFKLDTGVDEKQLLTSLKRMFAFYLFIGTFGFFVGTGMGGAIKMKKLMDKEDIAYNDKLNLTTGENLTVEIVGKNSAYLFYLTEESETVVVSPISVIESVEEIKED